MIKLALQWLKAHRWVSYLLVCISVAGLLGLVFKAGYDSGHDSVMNEWHEANVKAQEEARTIEREHAEEVSKLVSEHHKEVKDVEKELSSTIAALGSDNQQLRDRFKRRPACPLPEAEEGGHRTDSPGGTGLLEEDEKFLIQFAAEADDTAVKLNTAYKALQACENARTRSE